MVLLNLYLFYLIHHILQRTTNKVFLLFNPQKLIEPFCEIPSFLKVEFVEIPDIGEPKKLGYLIEPALSGLLEMVERIADPLYVVNFGVFEFLSFFYFGVQGFVVFLLAIEKGLHF